MQIKDMSPSIGLEQSTLLIIPESPGSEETGSDVPNAPTIIMTNPSGKDAPLSLTTLTSDLATLSYGSTNADSSALPAFGSSGARLESGPLTSPIGSSGAHAFGASNTPAVCSSSSPSGTSGSLFGMPVHRLSNSFAPSGTPAFGASGSSLFGASTTSPLFGASSTTPAFGVSSTTTPAFGVSSTTTPAFGVSSTTPPLFGASSTPPAFGVSSTTPAWNVSHSPFYASMTPAFGACSATLVSNASHSPFGALSGTTAPRFAPSAQPAFGWDNSPFGKFSTPPFGGHCSSAPSFSLGGFASWSPFWKDPALLSSFPSKTAKSGFQMGGSRVVPYKPTHHFEYGYWGIQKVDSISAMSAYNDMSHEELRWIDYWRGDKGGSNNSGHVIRITSVNAESDKISINIEIPSRVATQLLESLKLICINANSSSPNFSTPFSNQNTSSSFSSFMFQ